MPRAPKHAARSPNPRGPASAPPDSSGVSFSRTGRWAIGVGGCALLVAITFLFVNRSLRTVAELRSIGGQNILLITIDTLRADALGSYGGRASTPALDRLAADGVRFTFAHAHAVLTLPSHASILTGRYPFQHGVRENSGFRLPPDSSTLATLLKNAGYATAAFVAAFPLNSRFGLARGFDVYDDRFGETRAPAEFVMPERPASTVVPLARDWIRGRVKENAGAPWFAWVHVFDPHAPYQPPPPFDRQYAASPYFGEVAAVDRALGPLLDDLRVSERPTFVVVTGDHGEALGDHGEATHGIFAYESTLRVPLIAAELGGRHSQSGPATGGEVSDVSVRHVDILPSILDAAKVAIPADVPGRSFLSSSERASGAPARTSYFEAMAATLNRGWAPLTGVLLGREKYIDVPLPELYNLTDDPAERTNLTGRDPAHEREVEASLRMMGATLPGQRLTESAEVAARLRALGYASGGGTAKAHYSEADDPKRLIDLDEGIHQAVALYVARRFDEAATLYRQILSRRPDMALAYQHLAFLEWQRGNVQGAIAVLLQALGLGVHTPAVTTQLGTYFAEGGSPGKAIDLLEPLASTADADLDALNGLGIAYARVGRAADARRTFERMLTLSPDSGMAFENLGALDLERGDLTSARERLERAARIDPTSSQAQAGLGVVALKQGDRAAAISSWKRAVDLDPTNFDALYNLATTLARAGDREEARPYLEQFVRTAPPALYASDLRELSELLNRRP